MTLRLHFRPNALPRTTTRMIEEIINSPLLVRET